MIAALITLMANLRRSEGELKALEGRVVMVKWITGATFAGILALILRTFVQG
jgi:hypothetical protein